MVPTQRCTDFRLRLLLCTAYVTMVTLLSCQSAIVLERSSKMTKEQASDDVAIDSDDVTVQDDEDDDEAVLSDDVRIQDLKEAAIFLNDDDDISNNVTEGRNAKPMKGGGSNWWRKVPLPSFLTLVNFKNEPCTATATVPPRRGTCYTKKECLWKKGTPSGRCAMGYGQCCVFSKTCGDVMTENCTYFTNPEHDWGQSYMPNGQETCELKIVKCRPDICQIRLDFEDFNVFGIENGICGVDSLAMIGGSAIPSICGQNSGQHVYVNIPMTMKKVTLQLNLDSLAIPGITDRLSRRWRIKVSQIECSNPNLAPPGCAQYFTERTGKITSFNFGTDVTQSTSGYPNNMNYGVCIKKITGYCSIRYTQNTQFQFGINPNDPNVGGYVGAECGTFGNPGDYVIIPNAQPQNDRFCGGSFPAGGVQTSSMPYVLTVVSDSVSYGEGGFMLDYRQQPC